MQTPMSSLIKGYQNWLEQMRANRRSIWFGTLQFNHLGGGKITAISIMQREVERIYRLLLTNLFRNPRQIEDFDLPILIGYPDGQVAKRQPTTRLGQILPNEGMHYHFLLAVPFDTRLQVPLDLHVERKMDVYLGKQAKISKFDLRSFPSIRDQRTADYLFKHLKRGTYSTDDILILPAGAGEKLKPARIASTHPHPDELRAGFRRLLALYRPKLLNGETVKIRRPGLAGPTLLSIVPHTDTIAPEQMRATTTKTAKMLTNSVRTLSSATLVIPGAGDRTTVVGAPHLVLRELEAVFVELVVRDQQFQTTPMFADVADSLAPLVLGEYSIGVVDRRGLLPR